MSKVQSKRSRKKAPRQPKSYKKEIIFTIFYTIGLMYLYGMTRIYFPEPLHLGAGQYIDIAIEVLFLGLLGYGIILGIMIYKTK